MWHATLGTVLLVSHAACASDMPVQVLRHATAALLPDGAPERSKAVNLPFRWDHAFPGLAGRATFTLDLPAPTSAPDEPLAILLEGTGNQAEILVDGITVSRLGRLGDPENDAAKSSHVVPLPTAGRGSVRQLQVRISVQRQRAGGLGPVRYGLHSTLSRMAAKEQRWTNTAALIYAASFLLMGSLSAGLWWRQRDALYGCFSFAAFTGTVRNLDRAWLDIPIAWPYWGAVVAMSYALHIGLIARFVLLVLDRHPVRLVRALDLSIATAAILAAASFLLAYPMLWTLALILLQLTSTACLPLVLRDAVVEKRLVAWALLAAGTMAIVAGAHDLLLVRMSLLGGAATTLMPHAVFVFVLILGALIVDRYSQTVVAFRQLNASLAAQVARREDQLREAFETVRTQQQEQAVLLERQRMMRELHDGVGSHLVRLLNIVVQPSSTRAMLEEHVKFALDEMRMAVDSLQPGHDDLATVLATLRYRLQGRLDAAGIALTWDVEQMPAVPMTAQEALQLQRIVLEAFTNVLKHAHARTILLHVIPTAIGSGVCVEISDDGCGLQKEPEKQEGHGLANMRWRAESIGAQLVIGQALPQGTRIVLVWNSRPYTLSSDMAGRVIH
jgi:signal transduction histidine kinase